jgi:hypothetical protein
MKAITFFMTFSAIVLSFSSLANSGELDGKAVQCSFPEKWGSGFWVGKTWGVSFEGGKAYTISVPTTYPPKIAKKSFKRMEKYIVDEENIKWMTPWLNRKFGWRVYFLDRKTLKISSSTVDALERGERPDPVKNSKCKISSIKEITLALSKPLELMKKISAERKKKNKL